MLVLDLRHKKIGDFLYADSLLEVLQDGEVLIFREMWDSSCLAFFTKVDNKLYKIDTTHLIEFSVLDCLDFSCVIKSKCDYHYLFEKFSNSRVSYRLSTNMKYVNFAHHGLIEITGKELKLYDFVYMIDNNFMTQFGILVSSNKIMLETGEIKIAYFCEKIETIYPHLKSIYQHLQSMYRLWSQPSKKLEDKEYQIGDVYHKNNYISICLGVRYAEFSCNTLLLDIDKEVNLEPINEYYGNSSNDVLWLRVRISTCRLLTDVLKSFSLHGSLFMPSLDFENLVLTCLGNIYYTCDYFKKELKIHYLPGLQYNIKQSLLGDYVGTIKFNKEPFISSSFLFSSKRYVGDIKPIRANSSFLIYAKSDAAGNKIELKHKNLKEEIEDLINGVLSSLEGDN